MAPPPRDVKDHAIANSVNDDKIKEALRKDNFVSQLETLGGKLLDKTAGPNIITLEQFQPYIPLFKIDKEKFEEDRNYRSQIARLYNSYIKVLGINLYEPTIVILSKENPVKVYWLNRVFSRIKADNLEEKGKRDTIPAAINRSASTTRDQMILEASLVDLMDANSTPEQRDHFFKMKVESALIERNFVEHNLSPEKRKELMGDREPKDSVGNASMSSDGDMESFLDDDD